MKAIEVYRWFENNIKPNLAKSRDIQVNPGGSSMTDTYFAKSRLCGRNVDFSEFISEDTTFITTDNPSGESVNTLLFIY